MVLWAIVCHVEYVDYDHDITFSFTAPKGVECVYDPIPMTKVDNFLRHEARNMMFIYGETDPWSAPAVQISGANNVVNVIKKGGAHSKELEIYKKSRNWRYTKF